MVVEAAPRQPLIQYAVSLFGGAAGGVVQARGPAAHVRAACSPCRHRQSLEWFAERLLRDADGDVADEFLSEAEPGARGQKRGSGGETPRGALRRLAVTTHAHIGPFLRMREGWPVWT